MQINSFYLHARPWKIESHGNLTTILTTTFSLQSCKYNCRSLFPTTSLVGMYLLSGKDPESASSLVQDKCAQKPSENSKLGNKAACLHVDRAENLTELGEKWLLSHSKLKQLIRPGSNLLPDSSDHKRLGNAFWESCLETAARCKAWVFEAIEESQFLFVSFLS